MSAPGMGINAPLRYRVLGHGLLADGAHRDRWASKCYRLTPTSPTVCEAINATP